MSTKSAAPNSGDTDEPSGPSGPNLRERKERFDRKYDAVVGRAKARGMAAFMNNMDRGPSLFGDTRGQGTNMVGLFIGLLIAAIVVVQVFIPVIQDAIANSGVSGTEQTILELLPLFASLLLLIALAAPLMRRL